MEQAGYDVAAGETWLINEFDRTTARNAPRQLPWDHDWPPARRADMRELMRGLYTGAPGMAPRAGGRRDRNPLPPPEPSEHRPLQTRHEKGGSPTQHSGQMPTGTCAGSQSRAIRIPDFGLPVGSSLPSSRPATWRHTSSIYLSLLQTGPSTVRTARELLRTRTPAACQRWVARAGREQFEFVTGHGNTILNDIQMRHFVSEQVYAIRRYAGAQGRRAPAGWLGFSWQPCNRLTAAEQDCRPPDSAFRASLNLIRLLGSPMRFASLTARATSFFLAAACSRPGTTVRLVSRQTTRRRFHERLG